MPPKSQTVQSNTNVTVQCITCGCNNIAMYTNKTGQETELRSCGIIKNEILECWIIVVNPIVIKCVGGRHEKQSQSTIAIETGNEAV